jgi:hypothetical protein
VEHRVANGAEARNTKQLEELGLAIPVGDQPATVGGVKVVAVPREGWGRFFEYVVLERETASPARVARTRRSRFSTG